MGTREVFAAGRTAVITGAASGIGLATARHCAAQGMNVVLADLPGAALETAAAAVAAVPGCAAAVAEPLDVADAAAVNGLADRTLDRLGDVAFLMNNAGSGFGAKAFTAYEAWRRTFDVNLWGVVNGVQAFTQRLIDQARPAMIVNTGSKQGITNPPGDPAYNATKAAVKSLTESLALELRNLPGGNVSAHLLIPGLTYTGLIARHLPQKPPAAWTSEQVVERMLQTLEAGGFYILCPDNETTPDMDARRILWGAGDVAHGRPALSRWHPDFAQAFAAHMAAPEIEEGR